MNTLLPAFYSYYIKNLRKSKTILEILTAGGPGSLTFFLFMNKVIIKGYGKAVLGNMLLIGAKIQEYRKRQGLSQEEFAARVGVTRQAVSKWETDKAYPDLDKLVAICDILQIGITGLVYGERAPAPERPAGPEPDGESAGQEPGQKGASAGREQEPEASSAGQERELDASSAGQEREPDASSAGEDRAAAASLRLWILLVLVGGLFLFGGALLVTVLAHHAWKQGDSLAERVRVERVYQQYTKADVSFFDDVSRRVVKTVWMDVNGIREGDSLICYTDGEQRGIYYGYRPLTLIVLGAVELVLLIMLLICFAECRQFAGKNGGPIPEKKTKKKDRPIPEEKTKKKDRSIPAEKAKKKDRLIPADEAKEKEQP